MQRPCMQFKFVVDQECSLTLTWRHLPKLLGSVWNLFIVGMITKLPPQLILDQSTKKVELLTLHLVSDQSLTTASLQEKSWVIKQALDTHTHSLSQNDNIHIYIYVAINRWIKKQHWSSKSFSYLLKSFLSFKFIQKHPSVNSCTIVACWVK